MTSCNDSLLRTDSEMVQFQEDNTLSHLTDSVYSVMGIIYKMQTIADRTVLLGDVRGDLVTVTPEANADLKALANFEVQGGENRYNRISDYYAVINNCNYFLANVNMNLMKRGERVFEKEYAAVKAFRAWTYLQAVLNYGQVPLVLTPVLTEAEAQAALQQTPVGIDQICSYFINDLMPYIDTKTPDYGSVKNQPSSVLFIPVRVLIGDLCLWSGRYQEAAQMYHDYLSREGHYIPIGVTQSRWNTATQFNSARPSLNEMDGDYSCFIPMETGPYYGVEGQLKNVYTSQHANNYYVQAIASEGYYNMSAAQNYCIRNVVNEKADTIYVPKTGLLQSEYVGDLRLAATTNHNVVNREQSSPFSSIIYSNKKVHPDGVILYRVATIYLRFAEALNRAGYTQSAFAVLKYGLQNSVTASTIEKYIDEVEREAAGSLLDFNRIAFTENNTIGIHARGCGDVTADTLYVLPQPETELASRADTVAYQQPLLEDMIMTEMALETAFEGNRFYDLMRVALRRNDPAYLADAIAKRNGTVNAALRAKLMNKNNWYLKK